MLRTITPYIQKDLAKKIVFITGPRQAGKTTLAKTLSPNCDYFNYDRAKDRVMLRKENWDRSKSLVIFDELHKMTGWKRWLKGIYDTEGVGVTGNAPHIVVTGSAKLNTYKKVGDSLAGRYFQYHLYPFDLKEVREHYTKEDAFQRLWECSGFPEPFIDGTRVFYQRWRRTHLDIILRQDLIDLQSIRDIQAVETLIELLRLNVGSTVSYSNLARTLEKDAKTIKRWLQMLEELYIIFKVTPYSTKVTRSILKEPKYYFYDCAQVEKDDGVKLENIIAMALLKELHLLEDLFGASTKLYFVRTKEGNEIDFLVVINNLPCYLIEAKLSDDTPSKHFAHFSRYFPKIKQIQLVKNCKREQTYPNGLEVRDVVSWLYNIDFSSTVDH